MKIWNWKKGISFIFTHYFSWRNFNNEYAIMICRCHFVDMLSDIKYMFDNDLMDEMILGKYDSYVDEMFLCRDFHKDFCKKEIHAAATLKHGLYSKKMRKQF